MRAQVKASPVITAKSPAVNGTETPARVVNSGLALDKQTARSAPIQGLHPIFVPIFVELFVPIFVESRDEDRDEDPDEDRDKDGE
jgi:hypothetical protein